MRLQRSFRTALFLASALSLCLLAVSCGKDKPETNGNVLFHTPGKVTESPESALPTEEITPYVTPSANPTPTETPAQTPTSTPTRAATPTPTPTIAPTPEPTPTPSPQELPTQSVADGEYTELSLDYETSAAETLSGLKTIDQVRFKVYDPENKKGLSTSRISHWFGANTPAQPKIFQQHYDEMGWSALTYDMKSDKNVIYLTFDCGYENGQTAKILDTLKEKNVHVAFFVTLDYLKEAPQLAARMINEGHIVGNHSAKHPDFSSIDRTRMASELQRVENYLRVYFGYSTRYFRYPAGNYSDSSMELLTSLGYRSIFWSYAYVDYDEDVIRGKQYAFDRVTKNLHPGEVLLLHAISQDNADALGDIIDYVTAQGYEFRTLDQYIW